MKIPSQAGVLEVGENGATGAIHIGGKWSVCGVTGKAVHEEKNGGRREGVERGVIDSDKSGV